MKGVVRTHHLVSCAPTIVRCFGLRSYMRCVMKTLFAREPVTFLECVMVVERHDDSTTPRER